MTRIRVLIVEDSATVRTRLREVLSTDSELDVVGEATDGKQAIELCQRLQPDVITMDMMMPQMSGLAATEYIMAHCPTPILVVSSSVNRGELFKTYDALAAGAVDVMEKPGGGETPGAWEQKLISTVKLVARIRVITHPRARLESLRTHPSVAPVAARASRFGRGCYEVVAVGASTGGPAAIVEVLRTLAPEFSIPMLLVLHINEPFGWAFSDWLDGQTNRRVRYAHDGDPVASASGSVIMAPPDQHLVVQDKLLRLTRDPERHSCRPSVDVLFESVAREFGSNGAACLLTGMGRDGAAGLGAIRTKGGLTIAQDEATSVVFGMPREAALLDAVDHVLPIHDIGPRLSMLADGSREPSRP